MSGEDEVIRFGTYMHFSDSNQSRSEIEILRFDCMNSSTFSSSNVRKQPSLRRSFSTPSLCERGSTAMEFCGGTAAGCAAICCCGPMSIVNLIVLTFYKVPRRLCRRAIHRLRRRRLAKKIINVENGECEKKLIKVGSSQFAVHPLENKEEEIDISLVVTDEEEEDEAVVALEKEMWNRFNSGGFWRKLSESETASSPENN